MIRDRSPSAVGCDNAILYPGEVTFIYLFIFIFKNSLTSSMSQRLKIATFNFEEIQEFFNDISYFANASK